MKRLSVTSANRRRPSRLQSCRLWTSKPESQIDFSDFSDIPEAGPEFLDTAKRGSMCRPLKPQTTLGPDADVLDWFKRRTKTGRGYQTEVYAALRAGAYICEQENKVGWRRLAKRDPRTLCRGT